MISKSINSQIKTDAYQNLSGVRNEKEIDSWVLQFQPEHQSYAYRLVANYNYLNDVDLKNDCQTLFSRLIRHNLEKPCYVGFGPFGKSGPSIGYHFRLANAEHIAVDDCISFEEIARTNLDNYDSIILIDDFVGSGNQAIEFWVDTISLIAQNKKEIQIIYVALAGYRDGKKNIESKTPIKVEILHELTEFDKAFSPTNIFDDYHEANQVSRIFKSYGLSLEPKFPLGYGGNQALFSFFYNTPNNTLPIFWSTKKGWKPLFPRAEPKKTQKKKNDEIKLELLESIETGKLQIDQKELEACEQFLNDKEALFDRELPTTTLLFDHLCDQGKISKFTIKDRIVYSTHNIAVGAAIANNINTIENLSGWCGLSSKEISKITDDKSLYNWKNGKLERNRLNTDLIIFDWSDTLVDEYSLDDAVCEYIPYPQNGNSKDYLKNIIEFRELLADLERDNSHLWYDYLYLGSQFGKSEEDMKNIHFEHKSKMSPLMNLKKVLKELKNQGFLLAIATNCMKPVLEWRAEILNLDLSLFDAIATSDIITNVGDKKEYIEFVLDKTSISAQDSVMVSDNFDKDLLPAKMLGLGTIWTKYYRKRARSYWGTPALPVDRVAYEFSRKHVKANVVDVLLTEVANISNVIEKK